MSNALNGRVSQQISQEKHQEENLFSQKQTKSKKDDWSYVTHELLDSLPQAWTRGLLYFLVVFSSIVLPWAILSKVDEIGTARGRLEPQGKTIKLDAPVAGTVAKIAVKEGEFVKAGQTLVELESELVQAELHQVQAKLEGQQSRLHQLKVLQSQLQLALSTQQQQTRAQELEKQAQVEQARQRLEDLRNSYRLQQEEKLAQVNQAQQNLEHSQTALKLLDLSLKKAKREVQRYQQLWKQGVIPETEVVGKEDIAQERQRLQKQAASDIEQARLRLSEQKSSYKKILHQAQSDISQAQLRVREQQRGYKSLMHLGQLSILKSEEQLKNLETELTTLQAEIAQNKSQISSLQYQLSQRAISAPVAGTIFELAMQRPGAVVQPGNAIAEIAPQGSSLVLRSQMATTESGSLKEGMPVRIKFDAYPFQDYGVMDGRLSKISPTSQVKETAEGEVANYELEIELKQDCIPTPNKCVTLRPGDTAMAEVIVRKRRIIDLILDPFKKLHAGGLEL